MSIIKNMHRIINDIEELQDELSKADGRRLMAELRVTALRELLLELRTQLADRVPPNANERFSMVNRIDAAMEETKEPG